MTADWFTFDSGFLKTVSTRITNEVAGVSRVLYDSEFFLPLSSSFLLSAPSSFSLSLPSPLPLQFRIYDPPPPSKNPLLANSYPSFAEKFTVTSKPPGTIEME